MATYTPEDLISHDLACPICFEDYDILCRQRAPKLLLCLHTFCFGCAQRLWQPNGTLECSLCRTVHSGVALNELFDNHVILEHLRKQCEEQDLELARRLDMEMRNRERRIFNSAPAPQPASDMVQLRLEDEISDEEEEGDGDEEDLQDMTDDGHASVFDSDVTVEEEEDEEEEEEVEEEDEDEEEEEEESGNEGSMNDLLDRCIGGIGGMLDAVNNVVQRVDGIMEKIDQRIDDAVEIDEAEEAIDDMVEDIDDAVVEIDEMLERQDHGDDDDSSSSGSDGGEEQDEMMGQMQVTLSWNHLAQLSPPHIQSEEDEEEEEEEHDDDGCHENDDNNVEEEEEDRWYSASELAMSPQWVDDEFSVDEDAPDSPDYAPDDWLLL